VLGRIFAAPTVGALNMHPGRLPDDAGLHTHQWGHSTRRDGVRVDAALDDLRRGRRSHAYFHQRRSAVSRARIQLGRFPCRPDASHLVRPGHVEAVRYGLDGSIIQGRLALTGGPADTLYLSRKR
jgi:hypothetical protein